MVNSNVYILQAMTRLARFNGLDCLGLDREVLLNGIFAQQDGCLHLGVQ